MEDFIEGTKILYGEPNLSWRFKSSMEDEILHGGFHSPWRISLKEQDSSWGTKSFMEIRFPMVNTVLLGGFDSPWGVRGEIIIGVFIREHIGTLLPAQMPPPVQMPPLLIK